MLTMEHTKGIILAGGSGAQLYPLSMAMSTQLVPVFDKPLIYYPLSTLMLAGIRDLLIITAPHDQDAFQRLLGDGSRIGVRIRYAVQRRPEGIAQAFLIGRDFIGTDPVALALGDNIFFGPGLSESLRRAAQRTMGATVFAHQVRNPERCRVVQFDGCGLAIGLENPSLSRSPYAVTGLSFYDDQVVGIAEQVRPSRRGVLEISDVNLAYLERSALYVERLADGIACLEAGTHETLLQASNFVQIIEERQGLKVACIEEVAFRMRYIDADDLARLATGMGPSGYGQYLLRLLREEL